MHAGIVDQRVERALASSLGPLRERLACESPYGRGLPRYVERELEEFLRCGFLEHGFSRVVCRACRQEHLVAFSCKRRGLCPSCNARRMFDTAAHLVDRVIPRVPIRQWILTFSWQVRYHAATWIRATDRDGLERLCRYGLHPPLSIGRLEALPDGRYAYRMKRRHSDGREVLHFTGEALLLRLIALIPPPRTHLVRDAGIFAPRARWRDAVTGRRRNDEQAPFTSIAGLEPPRVDLATLCRSSGPSDPTRAPRLDWATQLRRAFAIDVLVCPRCQGPMRLISIIEAPRVIGRILAHLGLSSIPARAGPRLVVLAGHLDTLFDAFDGVDPPSPLD